MEEAPSENLVHWAIEHGISRFPESAYLADMQRNLEETHRQHWLDMPVPALGGRTPRQAASDPALRDKLEALLLDFEEHEHYGLENQLTLDSPRSVRNWGSNNAF